MTKKMYSFRLPEDLMDKLRDKAEEEGTSVTELVIRFLWKGMNSSMDNRIKHLEDEVRTLQLQKLSYPNPMVSTPMLAVLSQEAVQGDAQLRSEMAEMRSELNSLKQWLMEQMDHNSDSAE